MRAKIGGRLRVSEFEIRPDIEARITEELSFPNPEYTKRKKRGYSTWNVKENLSLVEHDRNTDEVVMPRAAARLLMTLARDSGRSLEFEDRRTSKPIEVEFSGGELRDYQEGSVQALAQYSGGYATLPCGAGKTVIGAGLIAQIKERTIVFVHTTDLLEQWITAVRDFLGVEPGRIGGGRKPRHGDEVTIVMIQTVAGWLRNLTKISEELTETKKALEFYPPEEEEEVAKLEKKAKRLDKRIFEARENLSELRNDYGMVLVDECFVAGTMVGDVPIEMIKVGDYVRSYDESTCSIVSNKVTKTFKSKPNSLVAVSFGGEEEICTLPHQWFTQRGWVPAAELQCGDMVLCFTYDQEYLQMRKPSGGQRYREILPKMQEREGFGEEEENRDDVFRMRGEDRCKWAKSALKNKGIRECLLFKSMHEIARKKTSIRNNDSNEFEMEYDYFGSNEEEEPNERSDCERKAKNNIKGDGMETFDPGREWEKSTNCSIDVSECFGLAYGARCKDGRKTRECREITVSLQDRYSKSNIENSNRNRWPISQVPEGKTLGQEERDIFEWARVDCTKILKSGSDGRFGGYCPDGFVYNIEVENSNTYFVGRKRAVVHNCHHTPADMFAMSVEETRAKFRYGLTATPKRTDGLTPLLRWIIGPERNRVRHEELVERGFLELPDIFPVKTGVHPVIEQYEIRCLSCEHRWFVDAEPAERTGHICERCLSEEGELVSNHGQLVAELTIDDWRNEVIRQIAVDECFQRTGLILTARVDHAAWLAAWLQLSKLRAVDISSAVSKPDRLNRIISLRERSIDLAVATSLADEGLDVANLGVLVMAAPLRAEGRNIQRIGRVMRPKPNEPSPTVYDLVDEHGLFQNQWWARMRAYKREIGVNTGQIIDMRKPK